MKLNFTGFSDPGLIRSNNQDAYYVDPEGRFFVVADGMGGHAGGEEASRIATAEIQAYLLANWESSKSSQELLEQALWGANEAILQDQQSAVQTFVDICRLHLGFVGTREQAERSHHIPNPFRTDFH